MLLGISHGQIHDDSGAPLFSAWNASVPNQRYTNIADGHSLLFDFVSLGATGCIWHEEVTLAGEAISAREIACALTVVSGGSCPETLPPAWTGDFRFVLHLVAQPATGVEERQQPDAPRPGPSDYGVPMRPWPALLNTTPPGLKPGAITAPCR
jgi:hypothetical protein